MKIGKIKGEIARIIFSVIITTLLIQIGWLSPERSLISNLTTGFVVYTVTLIISKMLG